MEIMNSQLLPILLNLPDSPGVYFFKDKEGNILYIGRATSLNDRVRSYFSSDLMHTRGPLLVDMVTKADKVEFTETDSVLEAIILENNLIKINQPYFNTKEKDNRSYNYVVITKEEFPRVLIIRGRTMDTVNQELLKFQIKEKFGPYPQPSLLRESLRIVRKLFPFRDGKIHQESFYKSIKLSPDISAPDAKDKYKKTVRNISLFFQGKKKELILTLEKEMKEYAKKQEFEKAEETKRTIYALMHIQDIALIKTEGAIKKGFRIEAYDIAHMSGKNTVGVMVVMHEGEMDKGEYRKFKISKEANNDIGGIKEILRRRFNHKEWQLPNLIVVDGGIAQINATLEVIDPIIPVVSVVKDDKHKAHHILGDDKIIEEHRLAIIKANTEAHRFAISYHRNLRKRTFFGRR